MNCLQQVWFVFACVSVTQAFPPQLPDIRKNVNILAKSSYTTQHAGESANTNLGIKDKAQPGDFFQDVSESADVVIGVTESAQSKSTSSYVERNTNLEEGKKETVNSSKSLTGAMAETEDVKDIMHPVDSWVPAQAFTTVVKSIQAVVWRIFIQACNTFRTRHSPSLPPTLCTTLQQQASTTFRIATMSPTTASQQEIIKNLMNTLDCLTPAEQYITEDPLLVGLVTTDFDITRDRLMKLDYMNFPKGHCSTTVSKPDSTVDSVRKGLSLLVSVGNELGTTLSLLHNNAEQDE